MLKGDTGELTSPVQDRTQEATQIAIQNLNLARFDRHRCTLHLCYLKPSLHPPLCAHAALRRDTQKRDRRLHKPRRRMEPQADYRSYGPTPQPPARAFCLLRQTGQFSVPQCTAETPQHSMAWSL
jgi:hypothetical protein